MKSLNFVKSQQATLPLKAQKPNGGALGIPAGSPVMSGPLRIRMMVTPEQAEQWLASTNRRNRPLMRAIFPRVDQLSQRKADADSQGMENGRTQPREVPRHRPGGVVGGRPIMATAPQPATPPLMPMLPQAVKLPPCVNTHVTGPSQALCEAAYSPIEYVWMLVRLSTGPGCHEPRVCPAGSIAAVRPEVGREWTENGWAVWVINFRRVA